MIEGNEQVNWQVTLSNKYNKETVEHKIEARENCECIFPKLVLSPVKENLQ